MNRSTTRRSAIFTANSLILAAIVGIFFSMGTSGQGKITSVYTDLGEKGCKTIELDEEGAGSYRGRCKGVGGFQLDVLEGDIRQSIDVIFPDGSKSELNFWQVVSGAFSSVGPRAEWRVRTVNKKPVPFALIVRFDTSHEDPDSEEYRAIKTSYLVVSKIEGGKACVTDIVLPTTKEQNVVARKLADASAGKPCRERPE